MTKILPADPGSAYRAHKSEIDVAIHRVLNSGWYILGQEVSDFEKQFAGYCHVRSAIGVGSGTDALHLALRCCGLVPGDLVATVSNTAVATVAAIELAGARPVLVDIDPVSFTMDPRSLSRAIETDAGKLRAVIPVHLYGHPADMNAIMALAREHDLVVIEDCAQAHGALRDGQMTGTWGHMAAFSFYPTKNLGALGDAGAVVTNSIELANRARLLQQYGWEHRYISKRAGMNTRLDAIQAAVLGVKLPSLDQENFRRREIALFYEKSLQDLPNLILPSHSACERHVFHQYTMRIQNENRDSLQQHLREKDVGASILYPQPIHLQEAYAGRTLIVDGGLSVTEQLAEEILCLPVHPTLTDEQIGTVVRHVKEFCLS